LNKSYQALLQLYGEKVEQNEELRLDLDDVKGMYRQQVSVETFVGWRMFLNRFFGRA
jgi:TATA element modulatory factor 1 TATA binding